MNVECINAFVSAGMSVLKQTTQQDISTGKAYLKTASHIKDSVRLMVGFTGSIKGKVSLNMELNTALDIASSMMGGFPVSELDEMSASAVGELANMIAGNASTILYNKGIGVDITTPSVVRGQNLISNPSGSQYICIPLSLSTKGIIELDILING